MKMLALTACVLASAAVMPAQAAGVLVGAYQDDVTIVYRDGGHHGYGYGYNSYSGWSYDTRVNYRYPSGYYSDYDYQRPVVIYYRDDDRRDHRRHHGRHHHSRHCRH